MADNDWIDEENEWEDIVETPKLFGSQIQEMSGINKPTDFENTIKVNPYDLNTAAAETAGTIVGGLGGGAAGLFSGGPVAAYLGSSVGSEAGRLLGNRLGEYWNPRKDRTTLKEEIDNNSVKNIALDLAIPQAVRAGAGAVKAILNPAERALRQGASKLGSFLNKDTQFARAFTDNPRMLEGKVGEDLAADLNIVKDDIKEFVPEYSPAAAKDTLWGMLSNGVEGKRKFYGAATDQYLANIPDTIRLRDMDFTELLMKVEDQTTEAGVQKTAAKAVWDAELKNFARLSLTQPEYNYYSKLKDYSGKMENEVNDMLVKGFTFQDPEVRQSIAELARIKNELPYFENKVLDKEYSVLDLRKLKTDFDNNARWDRLTVPDNVEASKAENYKTLANIFRGKIDEVAQMHLPADQYQGWQQASEKFRVLNNLKGLTDQRKLEAAGASTYFETGLFDSHLKPTAGTDFVSNIANKITNTILPERNTPYARLERGLGYTKRPILGMLSKLGGGASTALQYAERGLDVTGTATSFSSPFNIGTVTGLAAARTHMLPRSAEALTQDPDGFSTQIRDSVLQKVEDPNVADAIVSDIRQIGMMGNKQAQVELVRALTMEFPNAFEPAPEGYQSYMDGKLADPFEKDIHLKKAVDAKLPPRQRMEVIGGLLGNSEYKPINPSQNSTPMQQQPTGRETDIFDMGKYFPQDIELPRTEYQTEGEDMIEKLNRSMQEREELSYLQ